MKKINGLSRPCGEGVGVIRHSCVSALPPSPSLPPQGGREQTEYAACADFIWSGYA